MEQIDELDRQICRVCFCLFAFSDLESKFKKCGERSILLFWGGEPLDSFSNNAS